jgi:acetyl-CoA acetyltransferase
MAEVFVVGAAATRFKQAGATTAGMAHLVAMTALEDAGLGARDIAAVFVASGGAGTDPGADAVAVRLGLRRLGFGGAASAGGHLPGRIEHVSPSAGEALHRAWQAVATGTYEAVLCVGAGRSGSSSEPAGSWPPHSTLQSRAMAARRYMSASGASVAHLARISAKNLGHGALSSCERPRRDVSPEQVLRSEVLAWPLTRLMVAACGARGAAVVLASGDARRRTVGAAPRLRACLLVGSDGEDDTTARAARLAYRVSGVGPEDLDVVELDDVTAASELVAYENLQLAPVGQGPELIDSGFTAFGGVLPVNTSGGLLSAGELPGASGLAQLCHLVWQLRGEAGALQVPRARVALAHSTNGTDATSGQVALTILSC